MEERLSFDTTFLIDIQKELKAPHKGRAHRFLEQHAKAIMLISAVAVGEYAQGFAAPEDPNLQILLASIDVLDIDLETSLLYAAHARRLREAGRPIGSNDLWIGCSALRHQVPLVTRNVDHLRRIEGLQVMEY
ncbi:MAG: type II toxin-antitoxin system VapC family toxin [Acidobacteria bacterium]|nr:type II toxin-antitoxin system VapC family toxin [Acidobacteriota bacterium]